MCDRLTDTTFNYTWQHPAIVMFVILAVAANDAVGNTRVAEGTNALSERLDKSTRSYDQFHG